MTIHELATSNKNIREVEVNTYVKAFGLKIDVPVCLSKLSRYGNCVTFESHTHRYKYVYPCISVHDTIESWEVIDLHTVKVYLPYSPCLDKREFKLGINAIYGKVGNQNGTNFEDI